MNRAKIVSIGVSILAIVSLGVYGTGLLGTTTQGRDIEGEPGKALKSEAMISGRLPIRDAGSVLTISDKSQHLSGILTARLAPYVYRRSITAYGEVVSLRTLIELRSSYLTASAQARKAVLQLGLSRNEYARAKTLFKSTEYVSLEKLQSDEAAYCSDLADSEAAFQNLSGLKGEILQEWGDVIAKWIVKNSLAAKALIAHKFSIILVTLPPDAGMTVAPRSAEVETIGSNMLEATLVSISPVSNPAIQGISCFYRVPTSPYVSVGMNVVVRLSVGKESAGVVIPNSAVVWQNGNAWIFLKTGSDRFVRKQVTTTNRVEGGWFVRNGIESGESVVINGAQLLLSQEFKAQAEGDDD